MRLMCQGRFEFEPIEHSHGIRMVEYFAKEFEALRELERSGLVAFEAGAIQVTAAGWFLVRAVAMVFDHHLQVAKERRGFSRVV
jgi:oxygen-independent coproporphyrinogen-3 oxidase